LDLPGHHPGFAPLGWLAPVFGPALYQAHQSAGTQWVLGVVDAVVAVVGLGVAFPLWSRRAERPELEPVVLQRAYFLDDIYDAVIARPGQAFARFCATVIEVKVIDGAVNGVGRITRVAGGGLRRVQTGYVRQYALGIVLGAVVLLAWMLSRAVS
jgi:NADH-quinone oxidoreductase subunit L